MGTDRPDPASEPGVTPAAQYSPAPAALPEPPDPYGMLAQSLADRAALVQLCLYALDRARSHGVAERIERGLATVGVLPVRPDGQVFDPAQHEAAGVVPTGDPALVGRIAETEVAGFADHGRLVRPPVVTVYQLQVDA